MPFDDRRLDLRIQADFRSAARTAALAVALVSLVVLAIDITGLREPRLALPDELAMHPAMAVSLFLAGVSLWCLLPKRRNRWLAGVGYISAALVALIGLFTLVVLLLGAASTAGQLPAGWIKPLWFSGFFRIGLNTACAILAVGIALSLIDLKGVLRGWAMQIPAFAVWLVALTAIIGYLDDVRGLHAVQAHSNMSALTSVVMFMLATAALFARPGAGFIRHMCEGNAGSALLRRLLPLTFAIPLVAGWIRLTGEKAGWYSPDAGAVLFTVLNILFFITFVILAIAPLNALLREGRRTSEKLQKEKVTLEAILEGADHSIITVDTDGTIMTFNRAAQRWSGYSAEEVIGRQNLTLLHDDEEIVERARQLSLELKRPIDPGFNVLVEKSRLGIIEEQQWQQVRKDGSRFPISKTITTLRNSDGKITGFLSIASDITKRLEVDRMKGEFISTVSHELRTPLTSIRGALALLDGGMVGGVTDEAQGLVHIAYNNSERLIRLVNDILDVEKIAAGKLAFNFRRVALGAFLKECVAANREYAKLHDVEFRFTDRAPGSYASVDSDRLSQVVANLLSNAAKFSPVGSEVEMTLTPGALGLRVSVADRGPGIPEDFQSQLFTRFAQVDSSDQRQVGGTGLGLSICKAIIERMNGVIGYEPRDGGGSVFYFELPEVHAGKMRSNRATPTAKADPHVLVCGGDPEAVSQLSAVLGARGFSVDAAPDADAAREKLKAGTYDAIVLDILLPGADGLTFMKELRAEPATAGLPVVVMSTAPAEESDEDIWGGVLAPLDWLQKPVDTERLQQLLCDALEERAKGQEPMRILHVEDDADLRAIVRSALADDAQVSEASGLREARQKLESQTFDLVILDLRLPDGMGDQLIATDILNLREIPVLIFSAYEVGPDIAECVAGVLAKGRTTNEQLVEAVRSLARQYRRLAGAESA